MIGQTKVEVTCDHPNCNKTILADCEIETCTGINSWGDDYSTYDVIPILKEHGWETKKFGGNMFHTLTGHFCLEHKDLYPRPLGEKIF